VMEPKIGLKGKGSMEAVKEIMAMDLVSDEDGFIYFHELLFKAMKRVYGEKSVKNKTIAEAELKTLRKVTQIRQKMIKAKRVAQRQEGAVNPFLTMMVYKMSFRGWRERTKK